MEYTNVAEKRRFAQVIRDTYRLYDKPYPQAEHLRLMFDLLSDLSLNDVEGAINAHVNDTERGKFLPKVADIRAQIEIKMKEIDGRPTPDEAWDIALQMMDEHKSVITNYEISEALGSVRAILDANDKYAARQAFKENYSKRVKTARNERKRARWYVSLGIDETERETAIREAVARNMLPKNTATQLLGLPPPKTENEALPPPEKYSREKARERLKEIMDECRKRKEISNAEWRERHDEAIKGMTILDTDVRNGEWDVISNTLGAAANFVQKEKERKKKNARN